jgi:hypothetical protein
MVELKKTALKKPFKNILAGRFISVAIKKFKWF